MAWTGKRIRHLRLGLGLTVAQFAQLLGIHAGSAYRWEAAGNAALQLEPLQAAILVRISQGLAQRAKAERQRWGEEILEGLLVGGTLLGLALVLKELLNPTRRPSARSRRTSRRKS